ncbi:putative peptidoglycan glycosyltransferase FtsW [Sphaerochaeta sp. PS]|uniref:FtsW/RodA/SpoVE family cell cycle protein n=1 Tax=Sphaerochaeta sp. PS TaxID=3076336 RepID=UPI0028A43FA1|nr:putative peptidoglycan glycosyltransferase FtsW [Sphaerochaeta sp. PS]MDT4762919.1 putative peptidoglycan glycosyltransferase FtsW [Sphaerochaeta sp. PS]
MDRLRPFDDWEGQRGISQRTLTETGGNASAFTFLCVVLILTALGLIMLYSASYNEALIHNLPHYYYFQRQLMFATLALVCSVFIRFLPLSWIRHSAMPLLLLCLGLMVVTLFTDYGQTRLGSRRWLQVGSLPSLQPSELVKVSTILFFAKFLSQKDGSIPFWKRFALPLIITLLFSVLILAQKDYSTTILYLGLCVSLLLVGGMKVSTLLVSFAFLVVPAVTLMLAEPYRVKRVFSFVFSEVDPAGINYQIVNSLKAIGSGGLFGVGLGNGSYKLGLIPEVQSDFIFASICEEIGFFGIALMLVLFAMFAILGYNAYARMRSRDRFLSYTAFGITTMIVFQAIINIAVVTGMLPPTGIPLPFFSQGGTNLFVVICLCALLYRILLISSGRIPLEKSSLPQEVREEILFGSDQDQL